MQRLTTLCAAALAALALASPALAGRGMLVGAAEDAGQGRPRDRQGEDGPRAARRLRRDPRDDDLDARPDRARAERARCTEELVRRGAARRDPRDPRRLPVRREDDPARRPRRAAQYAAFCAVAREAAPERPRLHRRQRAEPQPLLVAAVRRRRGSTWPPATTSGCSAQSYDALKAVDPTINVIGGAVSPHGGDDPNARPQDPLPHDLHPRPRALLPRERPHRADHGRARLPPVPRQLAHAARPRAPAQHHGLAGRLQRSSSRCSERRSTAPRSSARDAADLLRRVRRPVADPGPRRTRPTRTCRRRPPATPSPRPSRPTTTAGRSTSPTASRPSRRS